MCRIAIVEEKGRNVLDVIEIHIGTNFAKPTRRKLLLLLINDFELAADAELLGDFGNLGELETEGVLRGRRRSVLHLLDRGTHGGVRAGRRDTGGLGLDGVLGHAGEGGGSRGASGERVVTPRHGPGAIFGHVRNGPLAIDRGLLRVRRGALRNSWRRCQR